jgi:hypothetical protein
MGSITLDQAILEQWMTGGQVAGVGFALYEPVVLTVGPLAGSLGAVVALVSLTPEPVYTVEVGGGRGVIHLREAELLSA